jgi:hypothetical protein
MMTSHALDKPLINTINGSTLSASSTCTHRRLERLWRCFGMLSGNAALLKSDNVEINVESRVKMTVQEQQLVSPCGHP